MAGVATVNRFVDLSDADREDIRALTLAVYPPEQVAHWHGRDVEWAAPEWCVRILRDATLVSYVGVYLRPAECDGQAVLVGGIGNVKTHPAARGHGFASLGIRRALEFFGAQGVGFGLLVCEPRLHGFYANRGWRAFAGRLLVRQRGATQEFTLSGAMTYGVRTEGPVAGVIDLLGPPW